MRLFPALLAVAALATAPMHATAQVTPIGPRVPMGTGSGPSADGISVSGTAENAVHADEALLTIHISSRNNATAITQETLAPIVDAMVRAGVDRGSIRMPVYLSPQGARANYATIEATVPNPTAALLDQGISTVGAAFVAHPDLLLNNAQVQLTVKDCRQAADAARAAAIANARDNARTTAKQLGVALGTLLGAVATSVGPINNAGACTSFLSLPNGSTNDPSDLRVHVYANVTLRYAIR